MPIVANSSGTYDIRTTVNGRELLYTGMVHLEGEHSILIQIADLFFEFTFHSDDKPSRFEYAAEGNKLSIKLFNHNNPLGEGKIEPFEVATINTKKVYLSYFLFKISAESNARRFEFSLYTGEKA